MMGRLPDPSSLLAPGSLCSATWPRLEARLTTPLQLRSTSQPALSLSVEHRVPLVCGTAPPQRFRLHPELATRTSDASCRGCERATSRPLAFHQNHPVTRPRQERGVDSSKRLPSTGARRSPFGDNEPATEVRSFAPAIRLPTLFRIPAAGHEMLDRSRLADAHHIRPRRAARRLSTSAIDPIHEHHRAPTELRRTSPTEARRRSSFSPLSASRPPWAKLRMATLLSERSQSRCHGSGDWALDNCPELSPSTPRSLAVSTLPQPDRLGHPLSHCAPPEEWSAPRA